MGDHVLISTMEYGVFHDCLVPLLWATPVSRAGAQTFMIKYPGENAGWSSKNIIRHGHKGQIIHLSLNVGLFLAMEVKHALSMYCSTTPL